MIMSIPKIMLTGTAGFIFSNFVRKMKFEKRPYEFVSIDKMVNSPIKANIYVNDSHKFYLGDIADEHFVNRVFEYHRPDIVINGAAESHVDNSLKNPNVFIHSNVHGTQVLLNASVKYGVKKFVQISTDETLGHLTSENDMLLTEDAPLNPRNPYSASKASAELLTKAMGSSFGLNYCITRSSNNYGPRQTRDKFIPKVIHCIMNNEKIPLYGDGKNIRDWLYVEDNCNAIMKVAEDGKPGEIYNISANQEYSNIEVIYEICKVMGKGMDLIAHVTDRAGHDFRYGIDSTKMRKLGWEPTMKFKDGIAKTVEWYFINKWFFDLDPK